MQIGPYPPGLERIQNLTGYKPAMRRIIWRHRQKVQICSALILALWLNLGYLQSSYAGIDAGEFTGSRTLQSAAGDYFSDWFKRVDETQAVQPHWIAPLVTTTPLLTLSGLSQRVFEKS